MGWTYDYIDSLTLPDHVYPLTEYWKDFPPVHELIRAQIGYSRPLTTEEKWKQGAMNPIEFLEYYKKTKGKHPKG